MEATPEVMKDFAATIDANFPLWREDVKQSAETAMVLMVFAASVAWVAAYAGMVPNMSEARTKMHATLDVALDAMIDRARREGL
jgi:hypothetical protein